MATALQPLLLAGWLLAGQARPECLTAPDGTFERIPLRMVGPANMGGRVVDLAVDPRKPARFYLATATGGLWRTENGERPGPP